MTRGAFPAGGAFRCFVALPVSDEVRSFFASFVDGMKGRFPGYRFGAAHNLHITVQFLGDVPRSMAGALTGALERATEGVPAFRVGCSQAGAFPDRSAPRILHVAVTEGTRDLASFAARIRRNLETLGFRDAKPFVPHLTLGRLRKTSGCPYGVEISNIRSLWEDSYRQFLEEGIGLREWEINEVLLMESVLSREGPVYSAVSRVKLGKPNTRTHSL